MRNSLLSVAGTLVVILCCLLAILSLASAESTKEWKWQKQGVVLPPGTVGMIDEGTARAPCVIPEGSGTYRMYYTGGNRGAHRPGIGDVKVKMSICLATAKVDEPKQWQRHPKNPVFTVSESGFDSEGVDFPFVVPVSGNLWYMYYVGWGKTTDNGRIPNRTGLAISEDGGLTWKRQSPDPIIPLGAEDSYDAHLTGSVAVLKTAKEWRMWYTAGRYYTSSGGEQKLEIQIALATSGDGIQWKKYAGNPVVAARGTGADPFEYIVSKPYVLPENGIYRMWYSHRGSTYRIGYAESKDGIHWERWHGRAGIDVSEGWDSEMVEYAFVLPFKDHYRMWYTGNRFGGTGIGLAIAPK